MTCPHKDMRPTSVPTDYCNGCGKDEFQIEADELKTWIERLGRQLQRMVLGDPLNGRPPGIVGTTDGGRPEESAIQLFFQWQEEFHPDEAKAWKKRYRL